MPSCANARIAIAGLTRAIQVGRAMLVVSLACALLVSSVSAQSNAEDLLNQAQARETAYRLQLESRQAGSEAMALLERVRILVGAYLDISRLFPRTVVADDALWRGAVLAADVFWEFGQSADRATALRLFKALTTRYPSSPFVKQVPAQTTRLNAAKTGPDTPEVRIPAVPASTLPPKQPAVLLTAVRREMLPGALRITIELEGEAEFRDGPGDAPGRLFVDLQNARPVEALTDAVQVFPDDVVRQIRIGRQVGTRTRIALDLAAVIPHTTYALYNPYRVVIDFAREQTPVRDTRTGPAPLTPKPARTTPTASRPPSAAGNATPVPGAPTVNGKGGFSLSRQLGLGIARIVIDPGHGGHDPGAMNRGLSEAELVLDVASRLERLLLKQPGVEVVMTRRSDIFVPLEERTAIANREGADLFLSVHANASEDDRTRGVETYFLNFAPNPASEAVAARENAASARTMRQLPDIVKAIALNDKIDESRDFASLVQSSLLESLKRTNKDVRDLGVKQAPFMVLIGATMPSILAEISFLTNSQEASLLRENAYRQQIAVALFNGVMRYQRSLKADARPVAVQ